MKSDKTAKGVRSSPISRHTRLLYHACPSDLTIQSELLLRTGKRRRISGTRQVVIELTCQSTPSVPLYEDPPQGRDSPTVAQAAARQKRFQGRVIFDGRKTCLNNAASVSGGIEVVAPVIIRRRLIGKTGLRFFAVIDRQLSG